jgi:hypothetical protein
MGYKVKKMIFLYRKNIASMILEWSVSNLLRGYAVLQHQAAIQQTLKTVSADLPAIQLSSDIGTSR